MQPRSRVALAIAFLAAIAAAPSAQVGPSRDAESRSHAAGLAHRDWFKHLVYAPGFYTGYGVKTLPGVREGIEQGQYQDAQTEIARVANALQREANWIDGISRDLAAVK